MRLRLSSGLALNYRSRGAGPVALFLHPIGTRAAFWDPVIERLSETFRCIAVDLRGHGDSDVPLERFTLDDMADDCIELLRTLVSGPVLLVGCSMGAAVAQRIALRYREGVRAIVLSNSAGGRSSGPNPVLEARAAQALAGMEAIARPTVDRWFSAAFKASRPDVTRRVEDWLLEAEPMVHSWCWLALAARRYGPLLGTIDVPVLALAGSEDTSAPPQAVRDLVGLFPEGSYAELAGAGHLAPLEQPEEFFEIVRAFARTHGEGSIPTDGARA